jgi:DNA primase
LKGRGLTGEVALRFGLGYAPDGWQNLEKVYEDYQDDRLVETGLVIVSEKSGNGTNAGSGTTQSTALTTAQGAPQGSAPPSTQSANQNQKSPAKARRYDRFRERIMFPIRNVRGHVIGFGGRILHSGEPKYLNSPETPLFSKGNELYGLFEARLAIRERGFVLVVEGYMDVVALAQLGYPNAVATLGTACTPVHVQKLVRQTEKIVFSFDGDKAGRRAARRALEASLPHAADNREVAFLFLPAEHDPDSFIRENGEAAFAQAVARATPLSEFLLSEAVAGKDLDKPEGRAKALFDAKPMLQALPANALRVQIMHALAERLGVSVAEVAALCAVDQRMTPPRPKAAPVAARRRVKGSEERALRNLVMHPRLVLSLDAEALQVIAECAQQRMLFDEVIDHARQLGEQAAFRILYDVLRGSDNAPIYEEIFREILTYDENVRDLMSPLDENGDASDAQRRQEFEELAFQEVLASLGKMRYDAVARRLDALSGQAQLSPEERSEMMQLLGWMRELKQHAVAKSEASR